MDESTQAPPDPNLFGRFDRFLGINNVLAEEREDAVFLRVAQNCDLDNTGGLRSCLGAALLASGSWQSVWGNTLGDLFGVCNGDLVRIAPDGTGTVLSASVGAGSMVFQTLPDGNTVYMNGAVSGAILAGSNTVRGCGVPIPASTGIPTDVAGGLYAGNYQWRVSYVRVSDGQEGGAVGNPDLFPVAAGGLMLTGLPDLPGYTINVYLSSHNDDGDYLVGNTAGTAFTYTGTNDALITPCKTAYLAPPPTGGLLGFFRGRLLVATANVLWASRYGQYELFDYRQDYKAFSGDITFIGSVEDGIYVGTTDGVWFLEGDAFSTLKGRKIELRAGWAYSAVQVDGNYVMVDGKHPTGPVVLAVAEGYLCAGESGGRWTRLTDGVFTIPAGGTVTGAAFYVQRGIPQYVVHIA